MLPENREAVEVFKDCLSQWQQSLIGACIPYPALTAVMDIHSIENRKDCLHRVQIMENETNRIIREHGTKKD